MHSPFPGMDPYLEDPSGWSDFHTRYLVELSNALSARVSPNFIVRVEERVYLTQPDFGRKEFVIPDVTIAKHPRTAHENAADYGVITTPTLVEPLFDPEVKDRYLEILDSQNRQVITTIELMSPINKRHGAPGYEDFWRKRRELFESQVHWIEIDLLREGERPYRISGKSDYYALLKRGGQWNRLDVWFFNLRDPLPTIAVPLRPPFDDVPLNLQAAFDVTYERAHYAESIDYTHEPPPPPLREEDAAWVQEQVREWSGARTS
ncbi:MAG TPA: DUF4058 family protein [Anaerolineae bacterium]|nr:DUF4058 family protein [Anaerolineae bacterium]